MLRSRYVGRLIRMPVRFWFALSYYRAKLWFLLVWVLNSREGSNLTYDLTEDNLDYLAHTVAIVTRAPYHLARKYIDEARSDEALHQHVLRKTRSSPARYQADDRCSFGRRLGWYAFVRVLKPRVVVETGVDKGHGAVLLCAALLRNEHEGHPGRYFGTEINPSAGWLLDQPYSRVGRILDGDSIQSLRAFDGEIDLFINDSDHSAQYEYEEYKVVATKLSARSVVLGDNAHVTDKLARFSRESGREFLFFREAPKDHWYPGAGIGISYNTAQSDDPR